MSNSCIDTEEITMACGCCTIAKVGVAQWHVFCTPSESKLKIPHQERAYHCSATKCLAYQPSSKPIMGGDGKAIWPICVCGEIAQAHE